MDYTDRMIYHCHTWNIMYSNCNKSKEIIGDNLPFDLIKQHGRIFCSEHSSAPLKSDELQLLKKAIKRIGNYDKEIGAKQRFITPTKIFHHEKSDKFKLWHGLVIKDNLFPTELTWITINNKIVDLSDSITQVKGVIPHGYIYCGIEIPKEVARKIIGQGLSLGEIHPNWSLQTNPTTIFIQSFNELKKYYNGIKV